MSTWTWITGDQHLSNFGAWRNRAGEVVFSDNDFDEAAIYDFHIDVLRIAGKSEFVLFCCVLWCVQYDVLVI